MLACYPPGNVKLRFIEKNLVVKPLAMRQDKCDGADWGHETTFGTELSWVAVFLAE